MRKRLKFTPNKQKWELLLGRKVGEINTYMGLLGIPERVGKDTDLRQLTAIEAKYGVDIILTQEQAQGYQG